MNCQKSRDCVKSEILNHEIINILIITRSINTKNCVDIPKIIFKYDFPFLEQHRMKLCGMGMKQIA
jgi:hypothetical protein